MLMIILKNKLFFEYLKKSSFFNWFYFYINIKFLSLLNFTKYILGRFLFTPFLNGPYKNFSFKKLFIFNTVFECFTLLNEEFSSNENLFIPIFCIIAHGVQEEIPKNVYALKGSCLPYPLEDDVAIA